MKYLLITNSYPPKTDASGLIVSYIAKQLVINGHNVDVFKQDDNEVLINGESGERILSVKKNLWDKLCYTFNCGKHNICFKTIFFIATYLRKIYLAFHIWSFPDSSPKKTKRFFDLYKKNQKKYDCIISFFRPYSCLKAGILIGKDCSAKIISYNLDLIEPKDCPSLMPQKFYEKLIMKGDEFVFENSDLVVLPTSAQINHKRLYDRYIDKIQYLEFPTFVKSNKGKSVCKKECSEITFLFAGTLNSSFRNPTNTLLILAAYSKINLSKKIIVKFYGGGDCHDIIEKFDKPQNMFVLQNGRVPKEVIDEQTEQCDFLLNITNVYNAIVPSKIFEQFASCKPIINVVSAGDDGSFSYLKKYPLCFFADVKNGIENEINNLSLFVKENLNKKVDFSKLEIIYQKNTPKYVVDQLEKINNNRRNV